VPGQLDATASGSNKQAPDALCTVLELPMMGVKPPETCRALTIIKNIVLYYIKLTDHRYVSGRKLQVLESKRKFLAAIEIQALEPVANILLTQVSHF
jgi:hypothetical protein